MQKKSCRYLLPFEHNARMRQTERQTDKQTDLGTVTSIAIDKMSPNNRPVLDIRWVNACGTPGINLADLSRQNECTYNRCHLVRG